MREELDFLSRFPKDGQGRMVTALEATGAYHPADITLMREVVGRPR